MYAHTHRVEIHIASSKHLRQMIASENGSLNFDKETKPKHPLFEESHRYSLIVFTRSSFHLFSLSISISYIVSNENSKLVLKIVVSVIISLSSSTQSLNHTSLNNENKKK